jgi:hypothetical protein
MEAKDVPPDALRVTYKVTIEIEGGKQASRLRCRGDRAALSLNYPHTPDGKR